MRPIKLELKGFTSFRDKCELDFSGFDLFAITGQTGAGKTSLLDAMTYALYGKTSRLNKAGKDLISQGENNMSVVLHFRVGPAEYRVGRFIKGTTVTARLETSEAGEWKATSGSITDVNVQIERIVGLDFGGFTKTVILPQGKFDVFLRGEPKERREVLADLLDVEIYQRMMKAANERAKDASIRAEERSANLDPTATPEAKVDAEQRLIVLSTSQKVEAERRQCLVQSLSVALGIREKRSGLARSQRELESTERRIMESRVQISTAALDVTKQLQVIAEVDAQLAQTPYDGDLHLRLNSLHPQAQRQRALHEQLVLEHSRLSAKREELSAIATLLDAARERDQVATRRLATADVKRNETAQLLKNLQLRHGSADAISLTIGDIESALKEGAAIPVLVRQITDLERRSNELSVEISATETSVGLAHQELEKAEVLYEREHARDLGAALRHQLSPGEPCPVCEQMVTTVPVAPDSESLAQANRQVAAAKLSRKTWENRLSELRTEAGSLPARRELAQTKLDGLRNRLEVVSQRVELQPGQQLEDAVPTLRAIINEIKAADLDAQQAASLCSVALEQQRQAETALQKAQHDKNMGEAELISIQGRLETLNNELVAVITLLGDAPPLDEMTKTLSGLQEARLKRTHLESQKQTCQAELTRLRQAVLVHEETLVGLESQKTATEAALQSLQGELQVEALRLTKLLGETVLADSPDEATQIQQLEQASSLQLAAIQEQVQRCGFEIEDLARRMERNQNLHQELVQLKRDGAMYKDLGSWLNAGNFQQYLLGSAFEVLAKEGSRHLRRLSGDRYDFVFEDDEFLVSDHSNADETRSVKTLSGGESFLASLSLALALAESITQLNGQNGSMSLESLFLDEGFSTLDAETLAKVADAIELLQDGNRLIGIITHVQSLADQMPVRIEIEKTVAGSRIVMPDDYRIEKSADADSAY